MSQQNTRSSKGKGKARADDDLTQFDGQDQTGGNVASDNSDVEEDMRQAILNSIKTKDEDEYRRTGQVGTSQNGEPSASGAHPGQTPTGAGTELMQDTTIFEDYISLPLGIRLSRSLDNCMYMVSSNHVDLAIAEARYYGRLSDILARTGSGQLTCIPMETFLLRVFYELRIQTVGNMPLVPYSLAVANGDSGQWMELNKNKKDNKEANEDLRTAISSYLNAWGHDPTQNTYLWFHFQFVSEPPQDSDSPGPEQLVINDILHQIQHDSEPDKEQDLNETHPVSESQLPVRRPPPLNLEKPLPQIPRPDTIGSSNTGSSKTRKLLYIVPTTIRSIVSSTGNRVDVPETLIPEVPPTPVEKPTVLTSLGSEIKQGGIFNLNGLLPSAASPSEEQWKICCRLIPSLDPEQLKLDARARSIRLPYSELRISAVQFYSAYQMLQGGSGFLCHDMGLGKTHTVLATAALKALIVNSKRRCDNDWASQISSRHVHQDSKTTGLACPSQSSRAGDVQCYCVPDGVTRQLYDQLRPGATLVHIPSSARATWIEAVETSNFKTAYNFLVVSKSGDVPQNLRANLDRVKAGLFRMGATEKTKVVRNTFDLEWTSRTSLDGLGSYVFIVQHTDTTWLKAFQYNQSDLRPRPGPECVFTGPGTCYAAPIGLTFVDEAHVVEWNSRSLPMIMARSHQYITGGNMWFVTGTPFSAQGFTSLTRNAMGLIDSDLPGRVPHMLERYEEAREKRTRLYIQDFVKEFKQIFSHDIVLRFRHQSLFLGRPISDIQIVQPIIVSRRLPIVALIRRHQAQQLVRNIQLRLRTNLPYADCLNVNDAAREVRDDLYFISLFPAAAKLISEGKINVHESSMRAAIQALDDRSNVAALPEVAQYWTEVVKDSPKALVIVQEIDRMNADRRARNIPIISMPIRGAKLNVSSTFDPAKKKMVIVTPTTATSVYLFMYLNETEELQSKDIDPILYHRDLSQRQRTALQADFMSLDRNKRSARTIIGSFDAIGTGINLQSANYQVLTSPLPGVDDLGQAFARTNREGQTLPVEHKILILEESPVDRINMANLAQRDFRTDPYDLSKRPQLKPVLVSSKSADHQDLPKLNQDKEALLATGVFDGRPDKEAVAANYVRGDTMYDHYNTDPHARGIAARMRTPQSEQQDEDMNVPAVSVYYLGHTERD